MALVQLLYSLPMPLVVILFAGISMLLAIAGEAATVASTYFLGMKSFRSQPILIGMLTGIITLTLIIIFAFDHPFLGGHRLTPAPFQAQIEDAERFLQR